MRADAGLDTLLSLLTVSHFKALSLSVTLSLSPSLARCVPRLPPLPGPWSALVSRLGGSGP